jgi:hypothetical protein
MTVEFTNLSPFIGDFSFGKKPEVAGSQIWAEGGLTDLGDVMLSQKTPLHDSCRMGRRNVVMKLICSLGRECDGHTVHKLSQRRVTAE